MFHPSQTPARRTPRVAIIGGGPGGLFTAHCLQQRATSPIHITIYEASDRTGGKICTRSFDTAPVLYEAGAAELYDYSHRGADPLRELIARLGLATEPMQGRSVVVGGQIVRDAEDAHLLFGDKTRKALEDFDRYAHSWMSPEAYYEADWSERGDDPLIGRTFQDVLDTVDDDAARRFLATLVHSDLATEPKRTSASYGLQNYLMNDPDYLRLYTIVGGIELLPQALAERIDAEVRLREPVTCVEREGGVLRVHSARAGESLSEPYDFVVAALPNSHLLNVRWRGDGLEQAMQRHHDHFDYPAHYLRISILFREVFWHELLPESYLMLDSFGGCCLYNESSRNRRTEYGTLGWLLAGEAAMVAANLSDEQLIERALQSLPACLQHGAGMMLEGVVQRWIGEVNGLPGGNPPLPMDDRHMPQPELSNVFTVGDYLFDSTLNGVLDSADYVAELLVEEMNASISEAVVLTGAA